MTPFIDPDAITSTACANLVREAASVECVGKAAALERLVAAAEKRLRMVSLGKDDLVAGVFERQPSGPGIAARTFAVASTAGLERRRARCAPRESVPIRQDMSGLLPDAGTAQSCPVARGNDQP